MSGMDENTSRLFPSIRLLTVLLVFFANLFSDSAFTVVNFTLVCMTNSTAVELKRHELSIDVPTRNSTPSPYRADQCYNRDLESADEFDAEEQKIGYTGSFEWDRTVQSYILSSLSLGQLLLTIPAGFILTRFGAKPVVIGVMLTTTTTLLLSPVAAYGSQWALFAVRFVDGMASSFVWPITLSITARWVPDREFGRMVAFAVSGFSVGGVLVNLVSGAFCGLGPGGWQYSFYFWGALNGVFVVVLFFVYTEDPRKHRWIGKRELNDIVLHTYAFEDDGVGGAVKKEKIPVRQMLTSLPFLAIIVANFVASWNLYFLAEFMPAYFKEVLFLSAAGNGLSTALPFLLLVFGKLLCGFLSDRVTVSPSEAKLAPSSSLCVNRRLNPTFSVKLFHAVSFGGCGLLWIAASFFDCSKAIAAVGCIMLSAFFRSGGIGGYIASTYRIAPNFAHVICGFGEMAQAICAVCLPYIVGAITADATVEQWRLAIRVTGGISLFGAATFAVFGSGRQQKWAVEDVEEEPPVEAETHDVSTVEDYKRRQSRRQSEFVYARRQSVFAVQL